MSFGSSGGSSRTNDGNHKDNTSGGTANTGGAPFTPRLPSASVLLAGLMGLRQNRSAALSTAFNTGGGVGLGRRPALSKRNVMGGL